MHAMQRARGNRDADLSATVIQRLGWGQDIAHFRTSEHQIPGEECCLKSQ